MSLDDFKITHGSSSHYLLGSKGQVMEAKVISVHHYSLSARPCHPDSLKQYRPLPFWKEFGEGGGGRSCMSRSKGSFEGHGQWTAKKMGYLSFFSVIFGQCVVLLSRPDGWPAVASGGELRHKLRLSENIIKCS